MRHVTSLSHLFMSSPRKHPRTKFTPEEDILLQRFVGRFGSLNWTLAGAFVPGRSPRQCRERWIKYLAPANRFEPFTPEEDVLLRELHAQYGPKWMQISHFFKNRTDIVIKNRWLVLTRQDRRELEASVQVRVPDASRTIEVPVVTDWNFHLPGDEGGWPAL